MASAERIVAVSLLTQSEFDVLGTSLKRVYPVADASGFEDLIRALDQEVSPPGLPAAAARTSVGDRLRNLWR